MHYRELQERVRQLGHKLAVREIYGENTPAYFTLKREHDRLLYQLNKQNKVLEVF